MAATAVAILSLLLWGAAGNRAKTTPLTEFVQRAVTKQVCLLQSQRDMQKVRSYAKDAGSEASPKILYSSFAARNCPRCPKILRPLVFSLLGVAAGIGAGMHQLPQLQACLETWASNPGEGEIQVIGVDAKDSPVEAAKVHWDAAAECPDSHLGGACKDAVGLANAYERGVDWAVLLGTDNYVVASHVEKALKRFDPEEPLILGIKGREAFLQEQKEESEAVGGWGDVANCRVAASRNITIRNLFGLHAWQTQGALHRRDLTFHYVSATTMYEMSKKEDLQHQDSVLLSTSVSESTSATYIRAREDYVKAENMRRKHAHAQYRTPSPKMT